MSADFIRLARDSTITGVDPKTERSKTMPQAPHPTTPQEQVGQRMLDWKAAFEAKNVDVIMGFYAEGEDFSAFDLMPPIEFDGGAMWRRNWETFFEQWAEAPQLEFNDLRVYASGNLAFVRLLCRLVGTMGGHPIDMWVRQTNCFQNRAGQWLMIHDHVSFPTDFATGLSLMALTPSEAFGRAHAEE